LPCSVVFVFVSRRLSAFVCWWQELELRARDRYDALDQMSAELCQLREQRDAFDALAEALRTRDGWLAYRAVALRDQLLELEVQATARPSTIERIRTALIDRDEALQEARGDRERARTVATDWEAEVVSVRTQDREARAALLEALSQQSRAEERAREAEQRDKEAEELKTALAAKVVAVAAAEEQLRQERLPARRLKVCSSRSGPLSPTPGQRLSGSVLPSRERRRHWRSGMPRFRSSTGR
jgi:chromosome segregation ATPase